MSNELDILATKLRVIQNFKEQGYEPSPYEVQQATNQALRTLRFERSKAMPIGMRLYDYEGKRDDRYWRKPDESASFFKGIVHQFDQMGINVVAGGSGMALSLSNSEWSTKAAEDMRKWANNKISDRIANDPELQAYHAWTADERAWSSPATWLRTMGQVIPSLGAAIGGAYIAAKALPTTLASGTVAGTRALKAGRVALELLPMFMLEGSNNYIEQMNMMVDEMGMSPEDAKDYAGISAVTYGVASAALERIGARAIMKGVPKFNKLVGDKTLMKGVAESLIKSGAGKGALTRAGAWTLAKTTQVAEKGLQEGITEWSQAALEGASYHATKEGFKDVNDFFRVVGEEALETGALEQAFGGFIMGVPFGSFSSITSKKSEEIIEEKTSEYNIGALDEDATSEITKDIVEGSDEDVLNNFLSSVGKGDFDSIADFWSTFQEGKGKFSKAISKVKEASTTSVGLLELIKSQPTVISAIQKLSDSERNRILRLAISPLNRQIKDPAQRIDKDNNEQMLHALKMFAMKGEIKTEEGPDLVQQGAPQIDFDYNQVKGHSITDSENQQFYDVQPTKKEIEMAQKSVLSKVKKEQDKEKSLEGDVNLRKLNNTKLKAFIKNEGLEQELLDRDDIVKTKAGEISFSKANKEKIINLIEGKQKDTTTPAVETKGTRKETTKKPKVEKGKSDIASMIAEVKAEEQGQTTTAELETESALKNYENKLVKDANQPLEEIKEIWRRIHKDKIKSGEKTEDDVTLDAEGNLETSKRLLKEFKENPLKLLEQQLKHYKSMEKITGKGSMTEDITRIKDAIAEFKKEQQTPTPTSPSPSKVSKVKKLTSALLRKNKDKVYLFGDNLLGRGKGGQAVIRDEPNAIGIPTKKAPSMDEGSFFNDADYLENVKAIDKAFAQIPEGKEVVLPEDGLGTGRARLEKEAPRTFKYLQDRLAELEKGTPTSPTPTPKPTVEKFNIEQATSYVLGERGKGSKEEISHTAFVIEAGKERDRLVKKYKKEWDKIEKSSNDSYRADAHIISKYYNELSDQAKQYFDKLAPGMEQETEMEGSPYYYGRHPEDGSIHGSNLYGLDLDLDKVALSPTPTQDVAIETEDDVTTPIETVSDKAVDIQEIENEVIKNQEQAELGDNKRNYIIGGINFKRVSNVIKSTFIGESSTDATTAGNTVDSLVRDFFTEGKTPVFNNTDISEEAYDSLMEALDVIKKQVDKRGLRVLSNNIIVWDDASGVAGEIDLFVLNPKTGNIQIWDVKTSKSSVYSRAYDKVFKGKEFKRSKRQQHSTQLSAYKRLIENQYGVEVEKMVIMPFLINYNKNGKVQTLKKEKGLELDFNESFINTVIEPNSRSAAIVPTKKENIEEPDTGQTYDMNQPSDKEIILMSKSLNTILGKQADDTKENKGYEKGGIPKISEDDDYLQQPGVSPLPKITSNKELAKKIVSRLRKHFGNYITDNTFEGVLDANGKTAVGVAIENVALWSSTDATLDTMPHEYAHIYIGLLKDTDLIKRGINKFKTEEKLVQHIGEYYANRIQDKSLLNRIKIWLKQFANRLKNIFRAVPDDALGDFIAEEFYQGRGLWKNVKGLQYDPHAKYQHQNSTDEDGNDTGVNSSRHSTSVVGSDIHIKQMFHKTFGVHIEINQVGVLSQMAQNNNSFEKYLEKVKEWAKDQAKQKSYRVNIKTEYNKEELNDLRVMYLKDRAKIPVMSANQKGLFTRAYRTLLLPTQYTKGEITIMTSPTERLDTGTAESQYETTTFFEERLRDGKHNLKLVLFRTKDILTKWYDKENNVYKYWQAGNKFDEEVFESLGKAEKFKYLNQIISKGVENANLLTILGMKGGGNSALVMAVTNKDHAAFTMDDFKSYLQKEIDDGNIDEALYKVMLEDATWKEKAYNKFAQEYLRWTTHSNPVKGEKIDDAKKRVLRQVIPYIESMLIREKIAVHEYMKELYYDSYALNEKHINDTFGRLSLPLTNGYSPQTEDGSLDSKIMTVPENTIVKVRTNDGKVLEAGTFKNSDGQTMSGSAFMNSLGRNIGTPNLSAIKTVINHRGEKNEDGIRNYVAVKHLQSTPFLGMEFYKEGENKPFARVAQGKDGTFFEKLDTKTGNVVDTFEHLNSDNEAKIRAGDFAKDYKVNGISEKDIKVIMNPVGSADTAAHPIALGEILLDPDGLSEESKDFKIYNNLIKQIENHYKIISQDYLSLLKNMRDNPATFLGAVNRSREEERVPTDAEKWMDLLKDTNGKGIAHKYITNMFISFLKNRYFNNGIFKARKIGRGHATHAYLKPAWHLENLIKDNHVAVSADNKPVYDEVVKHWASINRKSIEKSNPEAAELKDYALFKMFTQNNTSVEKINILNESLEQGDGVNVLIHRQPVAKVTGVVTRRVQFLVSGGHGDTMFLKNKDVKNVLDGDWDGDHGFAEFIGKDLLEAYQDWQNSDSFKQRNRVIALPMFKEKFEDMDTSESTYLKKDHVKASVLEQTALSGSEGRATNSKMVLSQFAYKDMKIYFKSLDGGFISARKPQSRVTITDVELDKNQLNKNNGELLKVIENNKDRIVDKDGNIIEINKKGDVYSIASKEEIYLETSMENELSILLQMAVDNQKFGLLQDIGWNNDYIIKRIFKRSDNQELTDENIQSLRIIFNVQNFSKQRQGLTPASNIAGMARIVEDSKTLARRFWTSEDGIQKRKSPKEVGKQYIHEFEKMKKRMRVSETIKSQIENPSKIETNSNISPGEKLISSIGLAHNRVSNSILNKEIAGSHFLDYSDDSYKIAHTNTMNEMGKQNKMFDEGSDYWINKQDAITQAYKYLRDNRIQELDEDGEPTKNFHSLNDAFWDIYKRAKRNQKRKEEDGEEYPIHLSADHNKFLVKFVEDHVNDWLSLSDDAQDLVTIQFLRGLSGRTNILTLMPIDLMSPRVMKEFLPNFETNLKNIKAGEVTKQAGSVAEGQGYKAIDNFNKIQINKYRQALRNEKTKPKCK